ncbi:MAG: hypothetical protein J5736_00715 [Bacilli bacterium]|nr:hypothetical protein [Bacilli bacterium]
MWYSAFVKKNLFPSFLILPIVAICLSACTVADLFGVKSSDPSSISIETNYSEDFDAKGIGYYQAKGDKSITPFTYRDVNYSCGMDNIPSSGESKLLCVPVEFTDYPFVGGSKSAYSSKEQLMSDLNIAFNGEPEDTGYWESVSSFYSKSSYGKLSFTVDILDIYQTNETISEFYQADINCRDEDGNRIDAGHVVETLNAVVESIRAEKGDSFLQQYDSDQDGWIDGIIMIYSCPDFRSDLSGVGKIDRSGNTFWAYAYWAAAEYGDIEVPIGNLFFWASHSFLHEAVKKPKVDCHTFIHEFGHMLGLDDYYPNGTNWNAAGGLMMMDENILDHDMFSKTALGWTEPFIVTGKKNVTLTINPSQNNGDCIILPAGKCWNQTAFSEYLILDLYTPYGLNEKDSLVPYSNRSAGYTQAGIRIYHVDARLVSYTPPSTWTYYLKDHLTNPKHISYVVAASNCYKDSSRCDDSFSLLAMVDAANEKNFRRGAMADNDSLFQTGDTFTFQKYRSYFPNGDKWNDGSSSSVSITFDSVSATSATISFSF